MSADQFRVTAFYEQAASGRVVTVQIRQRIKGAANLVLSGGYLFDLDSLPALRTELDRVYAEAKRKGDVNDNGDSHD